MALTSAHDTIDDDNVTEAETRLRGLLEHREARRDGWTLIVWAVAALALFASVLSVGFAMRAIDESKQGASTTGASPTTVTLSEFAISPQMVTATTAGGLEVHNGGSVAHNLAVDGSTLAAPMIDPGASAKLDLSSLAAGSYTVYCQVPGHREAGMTAMLDLGAGGGAANGQVVAGAGATTAAVSADEMDAQMAKNTNAFVNGTAKTAGVGAQLLAPTVLADGTKQFDLTTKAVKWEVEPGKFVDAMAYNGTVPGPTIKVADGDKVRVVLHNELAESTSIHFHGIQTPNTMDGVPDITQKPVKPGESFTYEFVAHGPAVGMYHSHQDAVKQVPDGLAGAFLIGDEPLPAGVELAQSQIMMLNDAGTISYSLNGKSFPATAPIVAKQGDWIEVQYMNEGTQIHPMHLHGMPQVVIAKDGFALAAPQTMDTVAVAPGERYTVLVHATELGAWAWHCHILPHAERSDGMFGMVTALIVAPS